MDFEQLLADFRYEDIEWFIPVSAGVLIIVFSLLIGIFRGMSPGVLMALVIGGLMSMSPIVLDALEEPSVVGPRADIVSVVRSASDVAELNNDLIVDLSRVVASMRLAMESVSPALALEPGEDRDEAIDRFANSVQDVEERINVVIDSMQRSSELRQSLASNLSELEAAVAAAQTEDEQR